MAVSNPRQKKSNYSSTIITTTNRNPPPPLVLPPCHATPRQALPSEKSPSERTTTGSIRGGRAGGGGGRAPHRRRGNKKLNTSPSSKRRLAPGFEGDSIGGSSSVGSSGSSNKSAPGVGIDGGAPGGLGGDVDENNSGTGSARVGDGSNSQGRGVYHDKARANGGNAKLAACGDGGGTRKVAINLDGTPPRNQRPKPPDIKDFTRWVFPSRVKIVLFVERNPASTSVLADLTPIGDFFRHDGTPPSPSILSFLSSFSPPYLQPQQMARFYIYFRYSIGSR